MRCSVPRTKRRQVAVAAAAVRFAMFWAQSLQAHRTDNLICLLGVTPGRNALLKLVLGASILTRLRWFQEPF